MKRSRLYQRLTLRGRGVRHECSHAKHDSRTDYCRLLYERDVLARMDRFTVKDMSGMKGSQFAGDGVIRRSQQRGDLRRIEGWECLYGRRDDDAPTAGASVTESVEH